MEIGGMATCQGACRLLMFDLGLLEPRRRVSLSCCDSGARFERDRILESQAGHGQHHILPTQQPQYGSSYSPQAPPSSVIPVPKHRLDEAIAAAALTSLSSGPMALGVGSTDSNGQQCWDSTAVSSIHRSINTSGLYIEMPASSISSPPPHSAHSCFHPDAAIEDSDTTHLLFGDPIPRKRKNSGRIMFRCLWKNCGKVLSTSAAIQKHIRTVHLGRSTEQEHNDGEEDFYYTEIDVNIDTLSDGLSNLTPTSPTTCGPPSFPYAMSLGAVNGTELPLISPLSLSAPGNLCHVHSDHAYQALSPVTISDNPKVGFSWQSPPLLIKAPAVLPALSITEKVQPQVITAPSLSKPSAVTRKPRGEAKKCRKVYGMERRDMWCTACRWKKACQRFID
ncbi:zinc finger protein 704 isoform X2 [Xenopus laevis]|uniref:Zinc finger protein 704 isoform X2 n=1 Tax=Xenopus laevis TaxID=8355 RepID=A0A8J1LY13_XENLA|nr:zinc finger protein 704 isoform X2 [Xenopus laevis]